MRGLVDPHVRSVRTNSRLRMETGLDRGNNRRRLRSYRSGMVGGVRRPVVMLAHLVESHLCDCPGIDNQVPGLADRQTSSAPE